MSDLIKILPDSVANQIAAGEVVDRPAGAVKELLENAMDAGATQIDLVVKDAGRTLVQVIDNGCGMSDSDARLCFERHATSKIRHSSDLFAIQTMGFRGEALASIAAIAQVELRTRQHDCEIGTEVLIEGSKIVSQQPTACKPGTSISVKNLFFNVPARRNFLKKDSIEMSHIEEVFRRVTLVHCDIGFTLTSNGRLQYDLKPGSTLQRICSLFGDSYKERMFSVNEETDMVKIKGFVSRPEYSRRTRGEQYLFVNGRFVKHPAFSTAVEKAYTSLLPDRSYPTYFISLQVDPSRIDINIHPTKTEVKFVDDHAIFAILRSSVKRALGQFSLATELEFNLPDEFNIAPASKKYIPEQPKVAFDPSYNPFDKPVPRQTTLQTPASSNSIVKPAVKHHVDICNAIDNHNEDMAQSGNSGKLKGGDYVQFQDRYIITTLSSGLAIIDQQRATERIFFNRLSGYRLNKKPECQTLMFPISCTFSAADADLLNELLPDIKTYGFEVAPMSQCTFVVTATPSYFKENELQDFFNQMLLDYKSATLQKLNTREISLCASLAKRMSIKQGTKLSQEEMQQIVADLFAYPAAELSPSGKKTIVIINPESLFQH